MSFEIEVTKRLGETNLALRFDSAAPVTALVGPSGVGKTSVLSMIAGILKPDAGRIVVSGRTLFDGASRIDLPPEARRCGYVFQDERLFPHLSVRRNLLYGSRNDRRKERLISFDDAIDLLRIGHLLERRPRTLSGGEARRVAIGRALLAPTDFLLLDEPLVSLDAHRRDDMLATIERIRDRFRVPILYVSHQQDEVARVAGNVVTMT